MATVGNLVANLSVNTRPWSKGMASAQSRMTSFVSGTVNMLGRIGLAAQGVTAAYRGLSAVLSKPLSLFASGEQTQVAFTTLLGSAEKAKTLVGDLRKFAASTPLQLAGLSDSAQKLLAFGTPVEDVIQKLTNLGNAATGKADKMDRLVNAYGKLQAKGRASLEELNMFTEAGVPLMAALQEQLGLGKEELFKFISAGKLGFEDVDKALTNLTTGDGQFAGMMEKMADTLGGKWSTFMDNLAAQGMKIGGILVDVFDLKGVLDNVTKLIQGGTVKSWIQGIAEFGRQTVSWFQQIWDRAQPIIDSLGKLWDALVSNAVAQWNALSEMVMVVWDNFSSGLPTMDSVISGISGMIDKLTEWVEFATFAFQNWDTLLLLGAEHVKLFASNSWERLKTFFVNVGELAVWLGENWFDVLTDMWNIQKAVFSNIAENITSNWSEIVNFIKSGGKDAISFDWTPLLEGFESSIKELPQLTEPSLRSTTPEMERLYGELGRNTAKKFSEGVEEIVGTPPTPKSPEEVLPENAAKNSEKFGEAGFALASRNSREAFQSIQRVINRKGPQEKALDKVAQNSDEQLSEAQTQTDLLKGLSDGSTTLVMAEV